MLKIRFQRVGRKHEPVFRLVVVDSHSGPKSGKVKEILGSYDSRNAEKAELKTDRIKHWMSVGAQTSDTVHNILVSNKVIDGKKINSLPKKQPIVKEKTEEEKKAEAAEAKQEEAPDNSEETNTEVSDVKESVEAQSQSEEVKEESPKEEEKSDESEVAPEPKEESEVSKTEEGTKE